MIKNIFKKKTVFIFTFFSNFTPMTGMRAILARKIHFLAIFCTCKIAISIKLHQKILLDTKYMAANWIFQKGQYKVDKLGMQNCVYFLSVKAHRYPAVFNFERWNRTLFFSIFYIKSFFNGFHIWNTISGVHGLSFDGKIVKNGPRVVEI